MATPIPTAKTATTQTYDPTKVTPTTTTDEFNAITKTDSPLMTQAVTQSNQGWNGKGLLNSSMAQQAGQQAAYVVAANLAQQDAATKNAANQFNASAQNQSSQFNAQQNNAQNQYNAGQQNELIKTGMDADNKLQLAGIEQNYKTLMQANQSAADMYQQSVKNIESIQTNKDIDPGTKSAYISNQMTYLRTYMQMLERMNNMSGLSGLI